MVVGWNGMEWNGVGGQKRGGDKEVRERRGLFLKGASNST